MRTWLFGLVVVAACGGSSQEAVGPTSVKGPSGVDDLKIPKVDEALCDSAGKKVVTYDLNSDGKPDMWKLYQEKREKGATVEILVCKQVDLNHDGKKDYVAHYDEAGNLVAEEYDFDFDGKFDARIHFDKKNGRKYLVERMSGYSDKPDIWEKYDVNEKIESVRRDRNADGKPDYWEQYHSGILDTILWDDDYDGKVDRKEEARAGGPPPPETAPAGSPASAPAAGAKGSAEAADTTDQPPAAKQPASKPARKPAAPSRKKPGKR